jgi:hypothetical protein
MYPDDKSELTSRHSKAITTLLNAQTEKEIRDISEHLSQIAADVKDAVARKRRDDETKKRFAELDRQSFELLELRRLLDEVSLSDRVKFDSHGRETADHALSKVEVSISKRDPQAVHALLSDARSCVEKHVNIAVRTRTEWLRRKDQAKSAVNELYSLIEGLKADETAIRWYGTSVQAISKMLEDAEQAILSEEFDLPSNILKQATAEANKIIVRANDAQLKADERNYIVQSIGSALHEMGYNVGSYIAEHPHDSASAIMFQASNENGEGVSVSVPLEGEVMYDVCGYSMETTQRIDGTGQARVCDKAQGMLEEIHSTLAELYGVNMGELTWEDSDPDRTLVIKKELKRKTATGRGGHK